jgi:adenylate kinase family enzyme
MKTQGIFIAYPQTAEQVNALQAVMQALKIKFEATEESRYNKDFVDMILQAEDGIKKGKGKKSFIRGI